jgi:psp operon transcriptional activator
VHFASPAAAELGLKFPGFTAEAAIALNNHDWPGNVRELKNVIERAVFRWGEGDADGQITEITIDPFERALGPFIARKRPRAPKEAAPMSPGAISALSSGYQEGADLRAYLGELEKTIVAETLARNGDNQRRAAEALCLTYDQIRGIIKKHSLTG